MGSPSQKISVSGATMQYSAGSVSTTCVCVCVGGWVGVCVCGCVCACARVCVRTRRRRGGTTAVLGSRRRAPRQPCCRQACCAAVAVAAEPGAGICCSRAPRHRTAHKPAHLELHTAHAATRQEGIALQPKERHTAATHSRERLPAPKGALSQPQQGSASRRPARTRGCGAP
jgi:hypothetical protein